jgi:hypothetical protein
VLSFVLARRFGTLAGLHGPRWYMAGGPMIAAAGYLLMASARAPFDFWTQMLPGLVVFGVGLSVTVSPLTAAVLAAVEPAQSGVGSEGICACHVRGSASRFRIVGLLRQL